jgi:hypothetical protein
MNHLFLFTGGLAYAFVVSGFSPVLSGYYAIMIMLMLSVGIIAGG